MMTSIISTILTCLLLLSVATRADAATSINSSIITDTTWIAANSPYVVVTDVEDTDADFEIARGVTLTIEPGVVVKFQEKTIFLVSGTLNAQGTSNQKIVFTDVRDDSIGGDTNGDGSATTAAPGCWSGIRVENGGSATIDYAEIRYAGGYLMQGALYKTGIGSFSLTNSRVSDSASHGVHIYDDTVFFDEVLYLYDEAAPGSGTRYIDIPLGSIILSGILQTASIFLEGQIAVNNTPVLSLPTPNNNDYCNSYSDRTNIAPLLHAGSNFIFGSAGTSTQPCNINRNPTSFSASAWITYQITHSGAYVISNNIIENNAIDGVYLNAIAGSVDISGNTIAHHINSGINLVGASPSITKNLIHGNNFAVLATDGSNPATDEPYLSDPVIGGTYANANDIYNNGTFAVSNLGSGSKEIDATYNYWGDPAGPTPSMINGPVKTVPFLTAPRDNTPPLPLNLFFSGDGGGTVVIGNVSYMAGTTVLIDAGTLVSFSEIADVNSIFGGWSGDCSGNGVCAVTMSSAKNVTATFSKAVFIKNLQSGNGYSLLQDAYNAAGNGDIIGVRSGISASLGTLKIDRPAVRIILKGGFDDSAFTSQTGYSEIQMPLIIKNGSLVVDRMIIK